jgi:hypothetical protein
LSRDYANCDASLTRSFFTSLRGRTAIFERYDCSRRAVFYIELAQNVTDVLADRAGLRAKNDADIVITFSLRNPEENFGFAWR